MVNQIDDTMPEQSPTDAVDDPYLFDWIARKSHGR